MTAAVFFNLGLFVGWLLFWKENSRLSKEIAFLNGVEATLNAEKIKMKDGRNVLFIEGLFDEGSEE
jgi:hypothetical protein